MSSPLPERRPRTEKGDSNSSEKEESYPETQRQEDPPTSPGGLVAIGTRSNPSEPVQSGGGGTLPEVGGWLKEGNGERVKKGGWVERLKDNETPWLWQGSEKEGCVTPKEIQNISENNDLDAGVTVQLKLKFEPLDTSLPTRWETKYPLSVPVSAN